MTGVKMDSKSAALHARAKRVMPGGNTRAVVYQSPYPPYAVSGRGAVITDADGQERYDFLNNYTSLIHGHADPAINEAVIAQLHQGTAFAMPTEQEIALAELLVARVPSIEQVRFTNSGTEAVMMAVKAARAYTGRPKIAKFEGCFHGQYDYVEVSLEPPKDIGAGDPPSFAYAEGTPQEVLESVVVLPFNDTATMERLLEKHRAELAAVVIDPLPWRAGLIEAESTFLRRLRNVTREYGILLIFDEVICFRVAAGGMQSLTGIKPDLTSLGKIIGGGFPIGAVGGSAEVMSVFDPTTGHAKVPHGGTFTANPISMVAGLAAMEKMTEAEYQRLDALGNALRARLTQVMKEARVAGQATGQGSLFQIHLHARPLKDFRSCQLTPSEAARRQSLYRSLLAHGIFMAPMLMGCLSTPMREKELDIFADAFALALQDLE